MTKTQLQALIDTANESGIDAAYAQLTARADDDYEAECDAMAVEREDAHGDYAEESVRTARDDFANCDSRGRPLRPSVNDGGEPWWM